MRGTFVQILHDRRCLLHACEKFDQNVEFWPRHFQNICITYSCSVHWTHISTKFFNLIPRNIKIFTYNIRPIGVFGIKFRPSDFPNADSYQFCVVIVEWRCVRWFRESVKTSRVYSWYLSAVSTQLHFYHTLWVTTTRWGSILYYLQ